jgi:hypothetical protein
MSFVQSQGAQAVTTSSSLQYSADAAMPNLAEAVAKMTATRSLKIPVSFPLPSNINIDLFQEDRHGPSHT